MSTTHEIVILGANFAGVQTAHYLLRHTIPALEKLSRKISHHITVVAPNTKTYYKIGAPRAIAAPSKILTSELFLPIEQEFANYSPQKITFIKGLATRIHPSKAVNITTPDEHTSTIPYNTLIIAIGSKFHIPPLEPHRRPPHNHNHNRPPNPPTTPPSRQNHPHRRRRRSRSRNQLGNRPKPPHSPNHPPLRNNPSPPCLTERTSKRAEKKLTALSITTIHNLKIHSSNPQPTGRTKLLFTNATGGVPKAACQTHPSSRAPGSISTVLSASTIPPRQ